MRQTTGVRVRTLMAVVALIAFGFAVVLEVGNQFEQRRYLWRQSKLYREAVIHYGRALECKAAQARMQPYRPAERARLNDADRVPTLIPIGGFPSWQAEYDSHLYWGTRLKGDADDLEGRLKAIEARLLLPILAVR